jgi:hypothetical protein
MAQQELWAADLLLLFQGSYQAQVPAKFYEYLQVGKPILAVARKGALTDLIESTGAGLWADADDPGAIATRLLEAFQLPSHGTNEVMRIWSGRFHYRSLAGALATWIRELIS